MARKKLSRIQIHKKICEKIGMTTKSHIGYLSRKEMLEVLLFLEAMDTIRLSIATKERLDSNAPVTNGN
jgi:hypothetical protein